MNTKRMIAAAALVTAAALSLSGCSTGTSSSSSSSSDASGQTITVWAMNGDYSDQTLAAIDKAFTKKTGAKVKLETQEWSGITTKITTALSTSNPPDVLDIGNTQVSSFAATGGLMDLTKYKSELSEGNTWISGLEEPATIDGKLYAVPAFAASRAVIYNKTLWAAAGITSAPTTWDEFTADLDKVAAKNSSDSDFVPFYLPGQYWYSMLQFVWDAGGNIAVDKNGTWKGTTSNAKAQTGLKNWKSFQNTYSSKASQTVDTTSPDMNQLMAEGKTSAILSNSSSIAAIEKQNSKITDSDLGTFPMPGQSGSNQPSMIAGSDWAIAAKSTHAELAREWVKIAASSTMQQKWVFGHDGWLPNTVEGLQKAMDTSDFPEVQKGFFEAAKKSKATPASPNWATIEGDKSVNEFTQAIATGSKSIKAAASSFDSHLDEVLNKSN